LLISDLFIPGTSQWNTTKILSLFDDFSAQEIIKLHISFDVSPKYLWTPAQSGKYSIGSACLSILTRNHPDLIIPSSQSFWKKLWKLNLNDRLRLFLWKIAWNILPTTSRINSILPLPNRQSECPLCKIANDSLYHLFFNCIFARVVWRHSFWPLDSSAFDFNTMADWIQQIISPGISLKIPSIDHHKFQIFAAVTCDLLWFYRNKSYHEGITIDIRLISKHINTVTMEYYIAWHPSHPVVIETWIPPTSPWVTINFDRHPSHPVVIETWIPPTSPWVTINFDTAIRDSFSAQAAVCRNSEGRILHMASQISSPCNPNYGEALAAKLAISLATSLHLDHFILEGDSQVVISTLRHPNVSQDWRMFLRIGGFHPSF
jgi:hypothetical protein